MPRCTGPYHIIRVSNYWVNEVAHLVTAKKSDLHSNHLQFYSDDKLNATISLQEQIQHDEWEFHIEQILGHRNHENNFELKI